LSPASLFWFIWSIICFKSSVFTQLSTSFLRSLMLSLHQSNSFKWSLNLASIQNFYFSKAWLIKYFTSDSFICSLSSPYLNWFATSSIDYFRSSIAILIFSKSLSLDFSWFFKSHNKSTQYFSTSIPASNFSTLFVSVGIWIGDEHLKGLVSVTGGTLEEQRGHSHSSQRWSLLVLVHQGHPSPWRPLMWFFLRLSISDEMGVLMRFLSVSLWIPRSFSVHSLWERESRPLD